MSSLLSAGFLNRLTFDILDLIILSCGGLSYATTLASTYPMTVVILPNTDHQKCFQTWPNVHGGKGERTVNPWLRTTSLVGLYTHQQAAVVCTWFV